jgi:glycosyltransferase involved in cell wall biosynthesis
MSRIVIIPSQWEEPFGRIALEAMLSQVPVIASKTGGLPESVGDGGILIDDYGNVDRWVEAIEKVSTPRERRRIIASGKRHVKKFSLDDQVAHLVSILKHVA